VNSDYNDALESVPVVAGKTWLRLKAQWRGKEMPQR
jgi:hypothetical protein